MCVGAVYGYNEQVHCDICTFACVCYHVADQPAVSLAVSQPTFYVPLELLSTPEGPQLMKSQWPPPYYAETMHHTSKQFLICHAKQILMSSLHIPW